MERASFASQASPRSYHQTPPDVTISDAREILQGYLGRSPTYMNDSWLKGFLDVVRKNNVDLKDKALTLKIVKDIRGAERATERRRRVPQTEHRAPRLPSRADTYSGLRRMFKQETIFKNKPRKYLNAFLDFIKQHDADPHSKDEIIHLYAKFLLCQTPAHPYTDNPKSMMTQRLIDATHEYLKLGRYSRQTTGETRTARLVEPEVRFTEKLTGIFDLYPSLSNRNTVTEIIASTSKDDLKTTKRLIVGLCGNDVGRLNAQDNIGETPLTTAFDHCPEAIELLIELGADVNCANARGQTR